MNDNILSTNLERIKNATDNIRTTLELTSEDVIEDVATAVSDLQAENERLAYELEHCEDIVFNTYYNINLEDTESWRDMQKIAIPYKVNGFKNLSHYFQDYPYGPMKITGTFGQPTSLESFCQNAHFTSLDIPEIDTSKVTNFSNCFYGCNIKNDGLTTIQDMIDTWDTSSSTSFAWMFNGFSSDEQGTLDISHFDISNTTSLSALFAGLMYPCIGYKDWDVAHIDGFDQIFYNSRAGEAEHAIDLSHWYNNKAGWLNLNESFAFGHNIHKILLPNIDNSTREGTSMYSTFRYNQDCILIDIRKLILPTDNMYACFDDINPYCVIVVKDNTEKQKILDRYPSFKQVYTAAEYEENDHLYSTVHVTLYDTLGNLLPDCDDQHYIIYQYECYNENTGSWEQIGGQKEYYSNNEIILPMSGTYRVQGYYDGWWAASEEFTPDNDEMEVRGEAGPEYYTITVNAYDYNSHNLIEKELHLWVGEWGNLEDYGTFVNGTITFKRKQNMYTRIEIRDDDEWYYSAGVSSFYAYADRTCDAYLSSKSVTLTLPFKYNNDNLVETYVLTDQYRVQVGNDTYRNFYNNPAQFYAGYNWSQLYYDDISVNVILSKRNTETWQWEEIDRWVIDKSIGSPNYTFDDIIVGEVPDYANITVRVKDGFTGQLLDANIVNQNSIVNTNSYTNSYINSEWENPFTQSVVANMNYTACADAVNYDSGWCDRNVSPQPNENLTLDVYLYPEIQLTVNYVDREGHNIDGRYGQMWVNFCKNGEILSSWDNWIWTGTDWTGLISTRNRDMTCDSLQVYFYDETDELIYTSAPIPYTDGVLQYNTTISNTTPGSYTTITFNIKDEDSHDLINSSGGYVWVSPRNINDGAWADRWYYCDNPDKYQNPLTIKIPNQYYGHDVEKVRVHVEGFDEHSSWGSDWDGKDLYIAGTDYTKNTTNNIDIYLRRS